MNVHTVVFVLSHQPQKVADAQLHLFSTLICTCHDQSIGENKGRAHIISHLTRDFGEGLWQFYWRSKGDSRLNCLYNMNVFVRRNEYASYPIGRNPRRRNTSNTDRGTWSDTELHRVPTVQVQYWTKQQLTTGYRQSNRQIGDLNWSFWERQPLDRLDASQVYFSGTGNYGAAEELQDDGYVPVMTTKPK